MRKLAPKADIYRWIEDVGFVPTSDIACQMDIKVAAN